MKIAIITIYRNTSDNSRLEQYKKFIEKINNLKEYGNFDVFIIEQSQDNQFFNIGKLKNIGFKKANEHFNNYSFYIFTDIDIIPDKLLSPYYFYSIKGISCLAIRGTIYNYKSGNCFFGSCIGIDKESFELINGYPNNFWGWGGEDECLFYRCNIKKIKIYEPQIGSIIDLEKRYGKKNDKIKENSKIEKQILDIKNYKENGLNNLNYKDISYTVNNNCYHFIVDLCYKDDIKKFPQWFNFKKYSFKEVKELKKKTIKKYKKCSPYIYSI